jgi:hypothetical protein
VNWSLGDTVESPHGAAFENNGLSVTVNQSTMSDGGLGSHLFQVLGNGRGIGPSATFMTIVNQQPCAGQYRACGGPISPPPLLNATGTFADLFHFSNGPSAGEFPEGDAVIFINKTAAGGKDDTPFQLFTLPYRGNSGYSGIEYFPATALFSFQGPIKDNVLQSNNHPLCTNGADGAFNNQGCGTLAISVMTTASSSDTFPLPGMTAAGHCSQPGATNTAAATATGTYISTKAANSVTLTHAPTPGMKFDLLCTPY